MTEDEPEFDLRPEPYGGDGLGPDPARAMWGIYAVAVWAVAFFAPIMVVLVVLLVGALASYLHHPFAAAQAAAIAGAASTPIIGVLLASGTVWATRRLGLPLPAIGWRAPQRYVRDTALAVAVAVVVIGVDLLNSVVLTALGLSDDTLAPYRDFLGSPFLVTMLILGAVAAAPFGEEMYFRGLLLSMFDVRMRRWVAIVVAAMLFTVAHYTTLSAWAPLFAFAVMLGWLRLRTGSLYAPILAHLLNNAVTITVLLAGWV
ncbi:MAG: CPBP family intramembrane glutamic endopeptidase [Acidimicrobiia bacterium]